MEKKIEKETIYKYIWYFFLYSLIGWGVETLYSIYIFGHPVPRGFLIGPICPIYGFAALILILFFKNYKNHTMKLFLHSAIVFSIFEYFVSFYIEAIYQIKCWDYFNEFFNLNGRVSILFSVVWGIISILFINKIHPFIDRKMNGVLKEIPEKLQISLLHASVAVFILDLTVTSLSYIL